MTIRIPKWLVGILTVTTILCCLPLACLGTLEALMCITTPGDQRVNGFNVVAVYTTYCGNALSSDPPVTRAEVTNRFTERLIPLFLRPRVGSSLIASGYSSDWQVSWPGSRTVMVTSESCSLPWYIAGNGGWDVVFRTPCHEFRVAAGEALNPRDGLPAGSELPLALFPETGLVPPTVPAPPLGLTDRDCRGAQLLSLEIRGDTRLAAYLCRPPRHPAAEPLPIATYVERPNGEWERWGNDPGIRARTWSWNHDASAAVARVIEPGPVDERSRGVYLVTPDTATPLDPGVGSGTIWSAAWSPVRNELAFHTLPDGAELRDWRLPRSLYVWSAPDEPRLLRANLLGPGDLAWSPAGNCLLVGEADRDRTLILDATDGSIVAELPRSLSEPGWSPDGGKVYGKGSQASGPRDPWLIATLPADLTARC